MNCLQMSKEMKYRSLSEATIQTSHIDLTSPESKNVIITFKNGNIYKGPVVNQCMHGIGSYQWTDGAFYRVIKLCIMYENKEKSSQPSTKMTLLSMAFCVNINSLLHLRNNFL